tara:strand:- start:357 stop:2180 length:1824 start_codon:yes stop_codon:yes gene_type:complete
MRFLLRILKLLKEYGNYVILNVISNFLSIIFSLFSLTMVIPFLGILFNTQEKIYNPVPIALNSEAIKQNFYAYITLIIDQKGQIEALMFICILVLIMFFLRNLFRYSALYFLAPIRNGIIHKLRTLMHNKLLYFPLAYFKNKRRGDLTARLTSDLVEIEWSVMSSIEIIFKDPLAIILYLSTLILISPKLTLFVIILFPLTGLIIGIIGKSLKSSSYRGQKKIGYLLSIIDENILGLRMIKAFNIEENINLKFQKESKKYKKIMDSVLRKKDLSSPMSEFLSTIVMVVIMWFGGKLVLSTNDYLSAQEFIGYLLIFSQIIPPAKSLTTSFYHIKKGSAAAERIFEILDLKKDDKNLDDNKIKLKSSPNLIKFKNVSFSYDKKKILNNISLSLKKGEIVALVGESGSGKTTLADLLPRFNEISTGEISINEININHLSLKYLRSFLGIVNQDPIIFNDSIKNNIKLGDVNATEKEVIRAAKIANAHNFIMKSINGYETIVGDRGDKLSGGEKQRISIARAILKNPEILILDEATSALDTESEVLIQDALLKLMKSRTTLIIAHRFSTIKNADKIIVLEKGEIVESGTHKTLINQNGYYKKLYDLQNFD